LEYHHWQVMLIDASSQHVAFIDPFGDGFLQDIIEAIKEFYNKNQPEIWHFTE